MLFFNSRKLELLIFAVDKNEVNGFTSIPTALYPFRDAVSVVVPLPLNGSKIMPPFFIFAYSIAFSTRLGENPSL